MHCAFLAQGRAPLPLRRICRPSSPSLGCCMLHARRARVAGGLGVSRVHHTTAALSSIAASGERGRESATITAQLHAKRAQPRPAGQCRPRRRSDEWSDRTHRSPFKPTSPASLKPSAHTAMTYSALHEWALCRREPSYCNSAGELVHMPGGVKISRATHGNGPRQDRSGRRPLPSNAQVATRTTTPPAPGYTPASALAAGSAEAIAVRGAWALHLHSAVRAAASCAPARADHAAQRQHARPKYYTAHSSSGNRGHEHPIRETRW